MYFEISHLLTCFFEAASFPLSDAEVDGNFYSAQGGTTFFNQVFWERLFLMAKHFFFFFKSELSPQCQDTLWLP